MNPHVIAVELLDLVGYADAFDTTSIPRRVAPIFRFRDNPESFVFPPLKVVGRWVLDGAIASAADFERMVVERRATRLPTPLTTCEAGMLWLDEALRMHYGPQERENEVLRQEAKQRLQLAEAMFTQGNYVGALTNARWASAADEGSLHALVLEAASLKCIARSKGVTDEEVNVQVSVVREQAQDVPDGWRFDGEVFKLARAPDYAQMYLQRIPPQPRRSSRDETVNLEEDGKVRATKEAMQREKQSYVNDIRRPMKMLDRVLDQTEISAHADDL